MFLLVSDRPSPAVPGNMPAGPDLGVIEEARRRQRARRIRIALVALGVVALLGIVWALSGGAAHGGRAHAGDAGRALAIDARNGRPTFNVRLWPMLETVGQAGWCTAIEENGVTGGSACGGVATASQPFVMVQGNSVGGSHQWTTVAVTLPEVSALLVEGRTAADSKIRAPTTPLPGLPYGLRGARIVTHDEESLGRLPRNHPPGPRSVLPLNAQGQRIHYKPPSITPFQGTIQSWSSPGRPPRGACELRASGVPGLTARGGRVMSDIRPYPGRIIGHAFLPCIANVYQLQHVPLRAMVVLDAANPRARAAALPDFKPVPGAPGLFAEGGLTARRSGNGWLIVGQGAGLAQRMRLLRRLTATIEP